MYNVHTHKQRQGLPFSPFILVLTIPGPGNIFLSESRQFKIGLVWTFGRKWHWTAGIMTIPCTLRPNDDGGHLLFQFPFILRPPEVRWGKEAEHGDDFGSFSGLCSFFVSVAEDAGQQHQKLITTLKAALSSITVHPHILSSFFTFWNCAVHLVLPRRRLSIIR